MLVLSRKRNESILIDGAIRITVVSIRGNQIRLGIEAPDQVRVFREELCVADQTDVRADEGEKRPARNGRRDRAAAVAGS